MQEQQNRRLQHEVTIRIGHHTLSFTTADTTAPAGVRHEPYVVKSGISMAANLREAFRTVPVLQEELTMARVVLDTPVLLIPREMHDETADAETFAFSFPDQASDVVLSETIDELNTVVLSGINRDLKLVVDDHFPTVTFTCAMASVWRRMQRYSQTSIHDRLFAYFHEGRLDLFAFKKNRFKFSNQFVAPNPADALYYLLYTWKLLALNAGHDEVCLMGSLPKEKEVFTTATDRQMTFVEELRRYVGNITTITAADVVDPEAADSMAGLPLDLTLLMTK